MGSQILDSNQNKIKEIKPTQKEESDPINIEPINAMMIETIVTIVKIGPDAIKAASIAPRLWFKPPHPLSIEAIKRMMIPAVIISP